MGALSACTELGLNTEKRNGLRAAQRIPYLWIFLRLHGQKHTDISVTETKAKCLSSRLRVAVFGNGDEKPKAAACKKHRNQSHSAAEKHISKLKSRSVEQRTRGNQAVLQKLQHLLSSKAECSGREKQIWKCVCKNFHAIFLKINDKELSTIN